MLTLAVLISGNGSNLQAIIDAIAAGLPAKISVVISNNPDAYGLKRAQAANIPIEVINHKQFANREAFDSALITCLDHYQSQLIILAGFMRILTPQFIAHFPHRILNIHPSLLPKYPGLHTHKAVLTAGDQWHGSTVHVVTDALDGGPIIAQAWLSVNTNDNAETLQQRVQQLEHQLYPAVINLYAQGKLNFKSNRVFLNDKPLTDSGLRFELNKGFI